MPTRWFAAARRGANSRYLSHVNFAPLLGGHGEGLSLAVATAGMSFVANA